MTLADSTSEGFNICYEDAGNGFAFVDTGLTLPVVELTGLSPGLSSTAGKAGVGVSTTVTLTGTGAATSDRIKFVDRSTCAEIPRRHLDNVDLQVWTVERTDDDGRPRKIQVGANEIALERVGGTRERGHAHQRGCATQFQQPLVRQSKIVTPYSV